MNYDFSGVDKPENENGLYGIRYSDFVVPLVKAVQEISKMNDKKDALIDDLQKQINELRSALSIANKPVDTKEAQLTNALIEQNVPNPFSGTTTIAYTLPKTYSSAKIIITDRSGKTIKEVAVIKESKRHLFMKDKFEVKIK